MGQRLGGPVGVAAVPRGFALALRHGLPEDRCGAIRHQRAVGVQDAAQVEHDVAFALASAEDARVAYPLQDGIRIVRLNLVGDILVCCWGIRNGRDVCRVCEFLPAVTASQAVVRPLIVRPGKKERRCLLAGDGAFRTIRAFSTLPHAALQHDVGEPFCVRVARCAAGEALDGHALFHRADVPLREVTPRALVSQRTRTVVWARCGDVKWHAELS